MNAKPPRPYGWKNHRPVYSDANVEVMNAMYRNGASHGEIAQAIGATTSQSVKTELGRQGIRRPGRRGVLSVNIGLRHEAAIRERARSAGVNVSIFAARILKHVIDDDLFAAVLDEPGAHGATRPRRRR